MRGSLDHQPITSPNVHSFLNSCAHSYDALLATIPQLQKHASTEAVLSWIEMMAEFAGNLHTGRFADGALENLALEIGCSLPLDTPSRLRPELISASTKRIMGTRRVLHIATTLRGIGGHTRLLLNWVNKDSDSCHSLLVTRQGPANIPENLPKIVTRSGGIFAQFKDTDDIIEKALWVRQFAAANADIVVLHLAPNDLVPILAFAAPGGIPVGLVNVQDECFWLGCTVADLIINLRKISIDTNKAVRFARNNGFLPIPIDDKTSTIKQDEARLKLHIPPAQIMLLSLARAIKYVPSRRQSFYQVGYRILDMHPAAHLYIVGVRKEEHMAMDGFKSHPRMHFIGPVDDPSLYQKAADIYLEGFPLGSQTALLEAALAAVPCIRACAPASHLLVADDIALENIAETPVDEQAYINQVSHLILHPKERRKIGHRLRKRVYHYHVSSSWHHYLECIYRELAGISHSPALIPIVKGTEYPLDLAISEAHGARYGAAEPTYNVPRVITERILGCAFNMRQRGHYADAFKIIAVGISLRYWNRTSLMFILKLLPHKLINISITRWRRDSALPSS